MSAAPFPVPPSRRFVPALVEVNARRGVTISVDRQQNLARWAVHTVDAAGNPVIVSGPQPGQALNPSNKELAAQLDSAVQALGVTVSEVFCVQRIIGDLLKEKTALPVSDFAPSPDAMAAVAAGIAQVEERLVTGLTLACDASRGRGRNVNGCGWVLAYQDGGPPLVGTYTTVADHGRIRAGELAAIRNGLQRTLNLHPALREGVGDITVLSDSKDALGVLERFRSGEDCTAEDSEAQKECARIAATVQGMNVRFEWVRGHSGHQLNELADRLAVMARRNTEMGVDEVTCARMLARIREDARLELGAQQ